MRWNVIDLACIVVLGSVAMVATVGLCLAAQHDEASRTALAAVAGSAVGGISGYLARHFTHVGKGP